MKIIHKPRRCKICNKLIWFWHRQMYQVAYNLETGKREEYNHCHVTCRERYLSHMQRELLR